MFVSGSLNLRVLVELSVFANSCVDKNRASHQRPTILFCSSVDQNYYMTTDCLLYSSGLVFWIPPVTFKTACDMDYSYWPWDVQVCRIVIGSWTKSGDDIDILTSLDDPNRNASRQFFFLRGAYDTALTAYIHTH